MKVVLFCGGLGTRIREYSENIPKPMVPIGHQPILWHVMQYYSQYGHRDFVLCLGYKANVIKDYFLNYRADNYQRLRHLGFRQARSRFWVNGRRTGALRWSTLDVGATSASDSWRLDISLQDEEIFLANYSDGLTDAPLPDMIDRFKKSGKIGCFIAVRPPFSFHLAEFDENGIGAAFPFESAIRDLDQRWLLHLSQRDLRLYPTKAKNWSLSRSIA